VAMMFLADTNIFLEVLLRQQKSSACKKFLNENSTSVFISDFSLHSIGVILFRNKKIEIFRSFLDDTLPPIRILSLPSNLYTIMADSTTQYDLDFDDTYQYTIAKHFDLQIVTMDKDFKQIKDTEIMFL
jgi:predicted nucleic acid-binding protein